MARPPRQHDPKTRRHGRADPSHDVFVAARKKERKTWMRATSAQTRARRASRSCAGMTSFARGRSAIHLQIRIHKARRRALIFPRRVALEWNQHRRVSRTSSEADLAALGFCHFSRRIGLRRRKKPAKKTAKDKDEPSRDRMPQRHRQCRKPIECDGRYLRVAGVRG